MSGFLYQCMTDFESTEFWKVIKDAATLEGLKANYSRDVEKHLHLFVFVDPNNLDGPYYAHEFPDILTYGMRDIDQYSFLDTYFRTIKPIIDKAVEVIKGESRG